MGDVQGHVRDPRLLSADEHFKKEKSTMKLKKSIALGTAGAAAVASLMLTPLASGHATVSLLQPQGKALTAARVTYVLRVPNEKTAQNTFDVVMNVPEAVQTRISVKQMPDWVVRLVKVDTGQKSAQGDPIFRITKVRWIAKAGNQIEPGFYGEFQFRLQNPVDPQRLCFPTDQWYTKAAADGKPELVSWSGPSDSERPASCVDVVAS
jgi:uncharacterized protein YcnI